MKTDISHTNTFLKYLFFLTILLLSLACQNSNSPAPKSNSFVKAVDSQQALTLVGGELDYELLRTIPSNYTLYGIKFNPINSNIITYGDSNSISIYSMNLEPITQIESKNDEVKSIDISLDGKLLVCSGDDGYVEVWSLENYKLLQRMQANSEDVLAVALSSNGKLVASAGESKVIDIWNTHNGEQIARLEGHQEAITDIAFIDANRKLVSSAKDKTTKVWSVHKKKLLYSYLTPSNQYGDIKKSKFFDDYTVSALTEVESSEGNRRTRNGPPVWIYSIKFKDHQGNTLSKFTEHRGPITDISIAGNRNYMASSSEDKTIRLWDLEKNKPITTIVLKNKGLGVAVNKSGHLLVALEGDNRIKLFQMKNAYSSDNSPVAINTANSSAKPQKMDTWYRKQYAIVIGIDHYKRLSLPKLHNAVADGRSVASLLKEKGFSVIELYNENATKEKIMDVLKEIKQKASSDDSTLFYFAGHGDGVSGHKNVREGYILPYDFNSDLNNPNPDVMYYDKSALSISSLVMYSRDTKAKHIAIVLDSCFSGLAMESKYTKKSLSVDTKDLDTVEYDSQMRSVRLKPMTVKSNSTSNNAINSLLKQLLDKKSINILTAGDDQPVADGSGHSPFAQAFLNALKSNDNSQYIRFTTLAEYVKQYVESKTQQRQKPQYKNESLEHGDFIFRR